MIFCFNSFKGTISFFSRLVFSFHKKSPVTVFNGVSDVIDLIFKFIVKDLYVHYHYFKKISLSMIATVLMISTFGL